MSYAFEHVHLKSPDPEKTANWYVKAFEFEIYNDHGVRPQGDRFIECKTTDGTIIRISSARTSDSMGQGDASVHYGIEHFGIIVDDLDSELIRLQELGAKLLEAPSGGPPGPRIAFIEAPDAVRSEVMQLP